MGYTEAKWVAEAVLGEAAAAGLAVGIYRPYEVAGRPSHGAWNLENATCALFRLIVDTGVAPDIDLPLDLVPVDVVAAQIAHIALTRTGESRTYHLTNPQPAMLTTWSTCCAPTATAFDLLPFDEWVQARSPTSATTRSTRSRRSCRCGLTAVRAAASSSRKCTSRPLPRFSRDNADRRARRPGLACRRSRPDSEPLRPVLPAGGVLPPVTPTARARPRPMMTGAAVLPCWPSSSTSARPAR